MRTGQRLAMLGALIVLGATIALAAGRPAAAQPALPYLAYGGGLEAGQVVEAFVDGTSVGRTTADRSGQWKLLIEAGDAVDGDRVTFHLDGSATDRSVIFASGRFPLPPGIQLGAAQPATPARTVPGTTPARRPATVPPRPAVTPRTVVGHTRGCTIAGTPAPCARPTPAVRPAR